jgi:protein-tyrosine phosphatase
MIDLHSHILPGLDDGAENMDQSLEMARIYARAGYKQVVATPHWIQGTSWVPTPGYIKTLVDELNSEIKKEGINLTTYPGMEIALDPKIPDLLDDGAILTLNRGSYVLIEPPFQRLPLGWEQILFNVSSRNKTVLLAHAERCAQLAERPALLGDLLAAGIYLQVNWDSFLGLLGRDVAEMACELALRGTIHCLATDAHDVDHRNAGNVQRAAAAVEKLVGLQNLRLLDQENPKRVFRGEPLKLMDMRAIKGKPNKRRIWKIW